MRTTVIAAALSAGFLLLGLANAHPASASPQAAASDVEVAPECYRVTVTWLGHAPSVLVCNPL